MRKGISLVYLIILCTTLNCQTYPGKYLIWFKDKSHSDFSINDPGQFLSQRALDRRNRSSIAIDSRDLPVSSYYIDSLRKMGVTILNTSKWFNNCTVAIPDSAILNLLQQVSFLDMSKTSLSHSLYPLKRATIDKFAPTRPAGNQDSLYGFSTLQILLENGLILHQMGYKGKGLQIAVLDAGFTNVDVLPVFDSLRARNGILGARDFVSGGQDVYYQHPHGTGVLSLMAGIYPGYLIGTAPEASYWLLRTEDGRTEYIIEEDNWVSAAEFADSAGVDIITTSLGYSQFDNPDQDHSYRDMDGRTTRISQAADIAFSKGILVLASAGNQGNTAWHYISAPADGINVIAVGAVSSSGNIATFSSRGPSVDKRVKPNVMGAGWGTLIADPDGLLSFGSGTSYSAPIIAGLAASLWQAYPEASNIQIKKAIEESSSRFETPDSVYGYGIPDFRIALDIVYASIRKPADPAITAYPNPFSEDLSFKIFEPTDDKLVYVIIWDLSGAVVLANEEDVSGTTVIDIHATGSRYLRKGIYIVKIVTSKKEYRTIAIKI